MSEQVSYFRLGLFVLVSISLIILGIVLLGAGALMKNTIPVETYFDESVQGLDVGASVMWRGVRIGKVSRVGFVREKYAMKTIDDDIKYGQYVLVEMQLDPSMVGSSVVDRGPLELLQQRVDAGLRTRLKSSLTGPTFVGLDSLDPNANKPLEIPWKPQYRYIPSAPGTMAQVVSAVERLASEIEKAQLSTMVDNLNKSVITLNGLLSSPELQRILAGLAKASDNAGPAAVELRKIVRQLDNLLSSRQYDIEQSLKNLRKISENLAALSEDAKNNPSRAIFGNPPPQVNPGENK